MAELLLEIGFEEMPAPWLPGLAEQLRARFLEAAARESSPAEVSVLYTPRRLVLRAEVTARQPDREEPVWGPALKVAKDAAGKWTGAAQGFAKKNGVAVEDLGEGAKDPAKPGERLPAARPRRWPGARRPRCCRASSPASCAGSRSRSA